MTQFYTHIIEISTLHNVLDELEIEEHERKELIMIAESGVHHVVIDTILAELPEEDKKKFLTHLAEDDHEKIWWHLKEKIDGVEDKISAAAQEFLEKLHQEAKNISKKK